MKKITAFLPLLLCLCLLTGCGCKHEWKEATCETPKTCSLCEEVEGEPLGHSWQKATCEAPKTCSGCGLTEGEALWHSWADATCEAPKTCSLCGETEGDPSHAWTDWSFDGEAAMVRSCNGCSTEESRAMEEYLKELLAGHWDAVSAANLSRRSEDDPYWKDVRYHYSEIPYMKILEDGSHEVFAGSVHYTDCRLEFEAVSQVKIPPSAELCDAYYFVLRSESGKGVSFFYVPREDAVFLMGFVRMERES